MSKQAVVDILLWFEFDFYVFINVFQDPHPDPKVSDLFIWIFELNDKIINTYNLHSLPAAPKPPPDPPAHVVDIFFLQILESSLISTWVTIFHFFSCRSNLPLLGKE